MCRKDRFASIAYSEALNSDMDFKHGAIITKGSKVIVKGSNCGKRTKVLGQIHGCVHAEIDVANKLINGILRSKKSNRNLKKYIIWVVRAPNDKKSQNQMKFRNSKPCKYCSKKLIELGFTKIGYSDDKGKIIIDFIKNIEDQVTSSTQIMLGKHFK